MLSGLLRDTHDDAGRCWRTVRHVGVKGGPIALVGFRGATQRPLMVVEVRVMDGHGACERGGGEARLP